MNRLMLWLGLILTMNRLMLWLGLMSYGLQKLDLIISPLINFSGETSS